MNLSLNKIYIFSLFFLVGLTISLHPVAAAGVNLITNPLVENINSSTTLPVGWQSDTWGSNSPLFNYETPGYNSNHSLNVKLNNYVDGDAKWYFDPVAAAPNTDYSFTDYYKSDVPSSLVAMSLDSANTPTYLDVATVVPASVDWSQANYIFHTLSDTQKVSMLHMINQNGSLSTSNFSLASSTAAVVTTSTVVDFVPNNSMEIASSTDPNYPEDWTHSSWGTNTPIYEYANDGYDGTRSVKLTMTNYVSGDAKWAYTPVALERGKDYKFSGWFKIDANTIPHVVAQYIKDDGSEDYFGMPDPQPNGTADWQPYSDVFNVPKDVKAVSVIIFLSSNGTLQTDNFHITPYTYMGYDKGRVTLTFDDGFEQNVNTVLPILDQYNFKATFCDATQFVEGIPDQVANAVTFVNKGHEICSHSVTHPDLTTLANTELNYELSHSQDFLQSIINQPVTNFSSPFGAYNATVNNEIRKYYLSHRSTDEGFNSIDNFDPYRLRVQNIKTSTTPAQVQEWVNKAIADKTWLILVYHVVDDVNLTEYDTYKADFNKEMADLAASGVTVQRWDSALADLKLQQ